MAPSNNDSVYNSDNFNLTNWSLYLPVDSSGGASGSAVAVSSLTRYESPYFYDNPDGSMSFYAPVAGATTDALSGTRSELRELNPDGTPAGWTLATGGAMSATLAVNSLPTLTTGAPGKVIIGELQGTNCALVRLYDDGGKIYFKNLLLYQGQQDTYQLTDAAGNHPTVALNQKFSYLVDARGSTLTVKVFIGGDVYTSVTPIDPSWQAQKLCFKAGVWNDDAATAGTPLAQATGAGQATFYGLDMSHTAGAGQGGIQAPVAQTDSFAGTQDHVVTGNVLTNDTAPTGLTLSIAPTTQTTAHGSVVENANGAFTYTPQAGFTGADSFTYTLKDGSGLTANGTVNLTVNSSAPTYSPPSDHFNLTDWNLTIPVDGSGGTTGTAATVSSLVSYGSPYLYDNSDGSMSFYAPVAGATTDALSGTRSELRELNPDGTPAGWTLATGGAMSATLAVNSLPTLTTGAPGKVIIGELQGTNCALVRLYDDGGKIYFKNLLLYQGQQDTYQLTDAAGNHPTVALNQKFSYLIDAHGSTLTVKVYIGGDVYTSVTPLDPSWQSQKLCFKAGVWNDDAATAGTPLAQATGAGQATFYGLDMSHAAGAGLGGMQAPVAQADSFTGTVNHVITGNVLTNDSAPTGLTMSVAPATQTTTHGSVVENANGAFTYTPQAGFSGADSFTYTLKDGSGLTATGAVNVTVNGSSSPPVANPDNFTGPQNQPITGNVLLNDTDPNGLALSVAPATLATAHGSVVENANGAITYTPTAGYIGTDTFNYTLKDSAGLSSIGTVNVAVTPTTGYSLVFNPSFSSLSLASSSNPNGTWDTTYPYATPGSASFSGRTLSTNNEAEFYSDPTVGVNPFSVSNGVLTITAAAATPGMLATEAAANNGATLPYTSGLLTTHTSFAQTYGLYEITAKLPAGQGLWPALWLLPASGAWPPEIDILEALGNAPATDYMTLHTGASNTALGTTTQVPTAATAFNTYAVDWEPTTITFYVDGKQVYQAATPADMHQPMYLLMNLAVGGAGSWPGPPNSSTVFPAQMQISSVQVYASPNTIPDYNHIGVQATTAPPPTTPVNLPPVAQPDFFTGQANHVITGNVLLNDSDPNGLALSVVPATLTTAHGTVVENANGAITYTPAANYVGTDTFNYTVKDTAGLSSTGTVNVTISAPPAASPVAKTDNFTSEENSPMFGNVLVNNGNGPDTDPNGLALSVTNASIKTAQGGSVSEYSDGTFTYMPKSGFVGMDSFSYQLNDSAGHTSTGTVNVTVQKPSTTGVVTFGPGSNMLHGGDGGAGGGDTFVFKAANLGTGVDTIRDFSLSVNDRIDISDVLSGHYNPATNVLSNFVHIVNSGSNSIVEVDLTGHAGASGWSQVTTIFSMTNLNEQLLVQHGNLIV